MTLVVVHNIDAANRAVNWSLDMGSQVKFDVDAFVSGARTRGVSSKYNYLRQLPRGSGEFIACASIKGEDFQKLYRQIDNVCRKFNVQDGGKLIVRVLDVVQAERFFGEEKTGGKGGIGIAQVAEK